MAERRLEPEPEPEPEPDPLMNRELLHVVVERYEETVSQLRALTDPCHRTATDATAVGDWSEEAAFIHAAVRERLAAFESKLQSLKAEIARSEAVPLADATALRTVLQELHDENDELLALQEHELQRLSAGVTEQMDDILEYAVVEAEVRMDRIERLAAQHQELQYLERECTSLARKRVAEEAAETAREEAELRRLDEELQRMAQEEERQRLELEAAEREKAAQRKQWRLQVDEKQRQLQRYLEQQQQQRAPSTTKPPPLPTAPAATHTCENNCGFCGTFSQVADHELVCRLHLSAAAPPLGSTPPLRLGAVTAMTAMAAADAAAATHDGHTAVAAKAAAPSSANVYTCVHGCGFAGSYEVVLQHEQQRRCTPQSQQRSLTADAGGGRGGSGSSSSGSAAVVPRQEVLQSLARVQGAVHLNGVEYSI